MAIVEVLRCEDAIYGMRGVVHGGHGVRQAVGTRRTCALVDTVYTYWWAEDDRRLTRLLVIK